MSKRVIWGILLVIAGTVLLLDQMNIIQVGDMISTYWPSILILIGIIGLVGRDSTILSNLVVIAIGLFFQLRNLGYINVSIWQVLWPSILIIVGFSIIFQTGTRKHKSEVDPERWEKENIVKEDVVDYFTMFSGIENSNYSKNFQGGKVTAIFAGIELDLRDAEIEDRSAVLNITALFGGVDIIVPSHWNVEVQATPILGGVEKHTKYNKDENAPTLKVNGTAIFGGIEVK